MSADQKLADALSACEAENARLSNLVEQFQIASGLERGGDPGGIGPRHLEAYLEKIEAENARLRAALESTVKNCQRCGGRGDYYPHCDKCDAWIRDHDCPPLTACGECDAARAALGGTP